MYRGEVVCTRTKGSSGASNGSGCAGGKAESFDPRAEREARRLPHDVDGMIQCVPVCCNSVPNPWVARPSGRTAGPTNRRQDQLQTVAGRGPYPPLLSSPSVCHFKPHSKSKVPHTDRRTAQKVLFVPLRVGRSSIHVSGTGPMCSTVSDAVRSADGPSTAGGFRREDEQRWSAGHKSDKKWTGTSGPQIDGSESTVNPVGAHNLHTN